MNISKKLGGGRLTTNKPIEIKISDEIIADTGVRGLVGNILDALQEFAEDEDDE